MRKSLCRVGVEVVIGPRNSCCRKKSCKEVGPIVGVLNLAEPRDYRWRALIQLGDRVANIRQDYLLLSKPVHILPDCRERIWLYKHFFCGGNSFAKSMKLYYAEEPPESLHQQYRECEFHSSHLQDLADFTSAGYSRLKDFLYYLHWYGAVRKGYNDYSRSAYRRVVEGQEQE